MELFQIILACATGSAISCHLLSREYMNSEKRWISNTWFWMGLIGNMPVMLAAVILVLFPRGKKPAI